MSSDIEYGTSHCGDCGERFMGQEQAEVVRKDDPDRHLLIHAMCYSPEEHELA